MNELLHTLEAAGQTLGAAVGGVFAGAQLRAVSDDGLLAVLRAAAVVSRLVEALLVEASGEVAGRSSSPEKSERLTTRLRCASVSEVVQRSTRVSRRRAVEFERAARDVRHSASITTGELLPPAFPAMRAALGDGVVGVEGVLAGTGPLRDASGRIDAALLGVADEQLAATARGGGSQDCRVSMPRPGSSIEHRRAKITTIVLSRADPCPFRHQTATKAVTSIHSMQQCKGPLRHLKDLGHSMDAT